MHLDGRATFDIILLQVPNTYVGSMAEIEAHYYMD
jgi:hypothetical protein